MSPAIISYTQPEHESPVNAAQALAPLPYSSLQPSSSSLAANITTSVGVVPVNTQQTMSLNLPPTIPNIRDALLNGYGEQKYSTLSTLMYHYPSDDDLRDSISLVYIMSDLILICMFFGCRSLDYFKPDTILRNGESICNTANAGSGCTF